MEPKANTTIDGPSAHTAVTGSPPAPRVTTNGTPETVFGMKVLFNKTIGLQPVKLGTLKPKRKRNGRSERL